jgi:hypothetical protein
MRTPVPKCLQAKKTLSGTLSHLSFFAATGKPAPKIEAPITKTISILEIEIPYEAHLAAYTSQLREEGHHILLPAFHRRTAA